jgi:uncharacterized membrane protein
MAVPERKEVIVTLPESGGAARIGRAVDGLVAWLARHWLATFNAIVGVFFLLPFVAPVLMHAGLTGPGHLIYMVYSPTCHQLPERSYFLFGPRPVYSTAQLESFGVIPAGTNLLQREMLRYEGSPDIGYKVAFCERDAAMYGTIFLAGLAFGIVRRRYLRRGRKIPKLPLWGYALFLLPMAADGFTQLFGWRESDWLLRTITGVLFGIGTVWLAYPYIQEAMDDVLRGSGQDRAEMPQRVDA